MAGWLYLSCQARQPWQLRVRVKVLQNDVPRVVYLNFSRLSGDQILLLYHFLLVWVYFLLPKEQQSCINVGQANTQDCANERGECVYPVVPESLNLFSLSACENMSLEMLSSWANKLSFIKLSIDGEDHPGREKKSYQKMSWKPPERAEELSRRIKVSLEVSTYWKVYPLERDCYFLQQTRHPWVHWLMVDRKSQSRQS